MTTSYIPNSSHLSPLDQSIAHWREISRARTPGTVRIGPAHCALCHAHHNTRDDRREDCCTGCPVVERTGSRYCIGTPYSDARSRLENWRMTPNNALMWHVNGFLFRHAARRMLRFLESLRH